MRPNIVTQASASTRLNQWWEGIPCVTSAVVVVCAAIYLVCLFVGYDSFAEICFLPSAIVSQFQVYRIYTSVLFHGSFLHVFFNMLALVPLGSELERMMGSVRLLYTMLLLALSNAILHVLITLFIAHNPIYPYPDLMIMCSIGFSGILFSMIVMETSLSGVQTRSVFGLFNVPTKWYPWILLVVFQLLMTNVSLLGHLCGILSGFAYTYGLLNIFIPGSNFFSSIENSSWLATCVRRPKFILCTGGNPSSYIPTHSRPTSSGPVTTDLWNRVSSLMPRRDVTSQPAEDPRFPGRARTLATARSETARLSDHPGSDGLSSTLGIGSGGGREPALSNTREPSGHPAYEQASVASEEDTKKLVSMGFDKTQVEVALKAADGNVDVAVEILTTQQG